MFGLGSEGAFLKASGLAESLRFHGVASVEERSRAFFAAHGGEGLLVGVLPFDLDGEVLLTLPQRSHRGDWPGGIAAYFDGQRVTGAGRPVRVAEAPAASIYAAAVREAVARIAAAPAGGLRKVVLARGLEVEMDGRVDAVAIAERLCRDPGVTVFLVTLGAPDKAIVGATPELLVSRRGLDIASHPLAGSAPRSRDPVQDRAAAEALLRSEKDQREHAVTAEAVLDTLAPYCARLSAPQGVSLHSTATVWHLGTRIEGVLKNEDAPSAAGLAALLHPTPAVGGDPRPEALAAIRALEAHDRGYYAGAVGWVDGRGDGEWYIALRCAQIDGNRLLLNAGAGIVAGSDPEVEVAETAAKFRAMLDALGLGGDGIFVEKAA